ncbi:MAG TPA: type II toxin-antitoxin system VapC family toxin [Pyrinomonadaceae bacterium]|nr:type II toxin-antitoxin system VapC family toxin [Pyrinomonadaceae bacterium]
MKLLLDTHTFIWWAGEPEKLSSNALALLEDEDNELMLSVVSVWEIQIKSQLGKLRLNVPLEDLVESQRQENGLQILPIELEHVLALSRLPTLHKDPFDRLLIAQSQVEDADIVSKDREFASYPVRVMW